MNPPAAKGRRPRATAALLVYLVPLATVLSGCVERLLQVRTEPPGAEVFVNGERVGVTPLDHPFAFYGTVSVVVRRPGHFSRRVAKELSPPWYERFPLDFFAENLLPVTLRDHHLVALDLEPVPSEIGPEVEAELLRRSDAARAEAATHAAHEGELTTPPPAAESPR